MNVYLTLDDVLAIHHRQVTVFGGADGIRDLGLLEAAIARPQTGYYPDIVHEAAALWESLSQNHPFVDGNKRTALASLHVFLGLNGYRFEVDQQELITVLDGLYNEGRFRFEALVTILAPCVLPIKAQK
jgi:death-on-curing protein